MKLFCTSYEDDLRQKIREAKEFYLANEGKAIGPYHVKIEVCGSHWGDVVKQVASFLTTMSRGPDKPMNQGGGGHGDTYSSLFVKKGDQIVPGSEEDPAWYRRIVD